MTTLLCSSSSSLTAHTGLSTATTTTFTPARAMATGQTTVTGTQKKETLECITTLDNDTKKLLALVEPFVETMSYSHDWTFCIKKAECYTVTQVLKAHTLEANLKIIKFSSVNSVEALDIRIQCVQKITSGLETIIKIFNAKLSEMNTKCGSSERVKDCSKIFTKMTKSISAAMQNLNLVPNHKNPSFLEAFASKQ